jgi:hypothetical protein
MKTNTKIMLLGASAIAAVGLVLLLFRLSENIVHYNNKFVRRFPPHTAQMEYEINLKFNSYYFSGSSNGKIYLGNSTAPLLMTLVDTATRQVATYKIQLNQKDLPFKAPQIQVLGNDFFVFEGTVPYIFKGSIRNWKAKIRLHSGYYFSHLLPIDSVRVAVRYITPKTGESLIGLINLADTINPKYGTNLLQKQFDGIFDTDGYLMVDRSQKQVVYNYRYRNQYLTTNENLKLIARGNTIDTVSKAHVKITKVKSRKYRTFSEPPLVVNHTAAADNGLLFVNSALPGVGESEDLWNRANIIDVYDLEDQSYQSSFPVFKIQRESMRAFLVNGDHLFALIDEKLVCYKLRDHMTTNKKINTKKR